MRRTGQDTAEPGEYSFKYIHFIRYRLDYILKYRSPTVGGRPVPVQVTMCCIYCTSRTVPFHTVNTLTEWNTPTELFGTRFKRLICIENSTRIPATFSHCFEQSLPYSYMSLLWQDMPLCYVFCLGYLNSESPIGTHRIRHADETRTRSKDAIKIPNRLPF